MTDKPKPPSVEMRSAKIEVKIPGLSIKAEHKSPHEAVASRLADAGDADGARNVLSDKPGLLTGLFGKTKRESQ